MLINGEKWACDACVRGHRVSNCHHSDRQLQHIAKKGRPVSQCSHCRTLRKSRSAHVKCDCGEKSHSKASCTKGTEGDSKDSCCCSHGGRCSCALKREYHLEAVPESESDEGSSKSISPDSQPRPRARTSISENSALTVFTNGHHKPAQKHNNAHRKQGHPYVVPRHPLHGSNASANRSVDNLLHLNNVDALHSDSHIKDSIVSAQHEKQRQVKSEHASPTIASNNLEQLNTQLPPLDISNFDFNDYNAPLSADPFGYLNDFDQSAQFGIVPNTYTDWSLYPGLDFNNNGNHQTNSNFAISNYSLAPSFSGFDYTNMEAQPALTTTSTSGDLSEVEDNLYMGGPTRPQQIQKYGSDYNSEMGEDFFRFTMAQNYANMAAQNQNQNPPLQPTSNTGSTIDFDLLLKDEQNQSFGFNTGIPVTYAEPEKQYIPQTFDAFSIPVDETESSWYWNQPVDQRESNSVPHDPTWL